MSYYTHVIITFTNSHHPITAQQELSLRTLEYHQSININGAIIKASNIAEVLPIEQYYRTYPDKRPTNIYPDFGLGMTGMIKQTKAETSLLQMKKGLEYYINSSRSKGTDQPAKLISLIDQRLKEINT